MNTARQRRLVSENSFNPDAPAGKSSMLRGLCVRLGVVSVSPSVLILIRIKNRINNPLPSSNGSNEPGVGLKLTQPLNELFLQGIKAIKDAVVKELFP